MKCILIVSVFLITNVALAQGELASSKISDVPENQIKDCSSYGDFKSEPVGTVCVTSKKGQFQRVKLNGELGIQDLGEDGKIWLDAIESNVSHYKAEKLCKDKGFELPSGYSKSLNGRHGFPNRDSDFVLAESRGLREAFSGDMKDNWFWSSSVYPNSYAWACIFNGYSGYIYYHYHYNKDEYEVARCVSAASMAKAH